MSARGALGAGVRLIPLHNTRHTYSSLLVALKAHLRVGMRILRHSQVAVTLKA